MPMSRRTSGGLHPRVDHVPVPHRGTHDVAEPRQHVVGDDRAEQPRRHRLGARQDPEAVAECAAPRRQDVRSRTWPRVDVHAAQVSCDQLDAVGEHRGLRDVPPVLQRDVHHPVVGRDQERRIRGQCSRQLLDERVDSPQLRSPCLRCAASAVTGRVQVAVVDVRERAAVPAYGCGGLGDALPHGLGPRVGPTAKTGAGEAVVVEPRRADPGDRDARGNGPLERGGSGLQGAQVDRRRQCERVDQRSRPAAGSAARRCRAPPVGDRCRAR